MPFDGAVQLYQMEAAGAALPWFGSPVSRVAVVVEPFAVPDVPVSTVAAANASFVATGVGVKATLSTVEPRAPAQPSIAIA